MKHLSSKLFLGSATIFSWLLLIGSTLANPSQANSKPSVKYSCIDRQGYPTTLAHTERGTIELIVWKKEYFSGSGYTPARRCQEVTSRFQQHSDGSNLRYISTGITNGYKVICVSDRSGNCQSNGLLITIQPDDNPETVMRDLFNLAARSSSGGINLSGSKADSAISRVVDRNNSVKERLDVDKFLAVSPVVTDQSSNSDNSSLENEAIAPNSFGTSENETPQDETKPVITNPLENW